MVAGMPGSQKSGFALWLIAKWRKRTLYFSADQDEHETITRLAGVLTGHSVDAVSRGIKAGAEGYYLEQIDELPIQFCFDSAPSLEDIHEELMAYVELYDEWPELIVVDNAINVSLEHDNEWAALRVILDELQAITRQTGSTVMVLHHMAEGDPGKPQPRKALQGKCAQRPQIILSLAFDEEENCLLVAIVKNRKGKADPRAKGPYTRLQVEPECTRFHPWVQAQWGYAYQEQ